MARLAPLKLGRRVSVRQMQIFEAVARHRSFTRAAEELHLTQPTVSMQVRKLGDMVGLALWEQIDKEIYLTDAGQRVREASREVLDSLARLEMDVNDLRGVRSGHLKLAVATTAKYFAPRALGAFCARYPGVEVALKVTNRERLVERMAENIDDVYIMGRPPNTDAFEFRPFLPNPVVAIAPRNHPLAGHHAIAFQELAKEPFIMREPGSGIRIAIEEAFASHGVQPRVSMELGSNEAIKQAVASGLGISALSRHALRGDEAHRLVAILDVEGFPIPWEWEVGHAAGKHYSVVAQTFLDFLEAEGKSIAQASLADEPIPEGVIDTGT